MNRINVVTLGVTDLSKSTVFYEAVFGVSANRDNNGISIFELPGTWLSLFPLANLAADISPDVPRSRTGFSGITLGHNARSREDVLAIFEDLERHGAEITKPPQDTLWGRFGGYFEDPDGYFWEVVWAPMVEHAPDGSIRFKS